MDSTFWLNKWAIKDIGFHQAEVNRLLVRCFQKLSLEQGSRLFLPLCGKSFDIAWLLSKGYRVVGCELSKLAIEELFVELGMEPEISEAGNLTRYAGQNVDIFVGDIFELQDSDLGPVDAIYDRAALVALPENMRWRYARHLVRIANTAPQLLVCYEYDQGVMAGPPFSVDAEEVDRLYGKTYQVDCIESLEVAGGFKGAVAATERVWLLRKR